MEWCFVKKQTSDAEEKVSTDVTVIENNGLGSDCGEDSLTSIESLNTSEESGTLSCVETEIAVKPVPELA